MAKEENTVGITGDAAYRMLDGATVTWDIDGLKQALAAYQAACDDTSLAESTRWTYVNGASQFVRWLAGEFTPGMGIFSPVDNRQAD